MSPPGIRCKPTRRYHQHPAEAGWLAAGGWRLAAGASVAVLLPLLGCATWRDREEPPLPYRVAIVPFSVGQIGEPDQGPQGKRPAGGFKIRLDRRVPWQVLAERLGGTRFAEAAVLPFPKGQIQEEFQRRPREEKDAYWIQAASRAGANLLMECDLKVAGVLSSSLNEKFWLNLPLFLIGGPATYFVNDRSYRADARLQVTLHLLDPLVDGRATLSDGRAQLHRSEVRFDEATLDFIDRVTWNPLPFLASLIVPSAFLEVENERVRERMEHEISERLTEQIGRELRESSSQILRAEPVAGFFLDPRVEVSAEGRWLWVRGEAVLRQGSAQRLDTYSITLGDQTVTEEFESGRTDTTLSTDRDRYVRYAFSSRLRAGAAAHSLAIEIRAGGRDRERRTFCVPMPPSVVAMTR